MQVYTESLFIIFNPHIGTEGLANLISTIGGINYPQWLYCISFEPSTDFDALWFICSRILSVIRWRVTCDHRFFLNTSMVEKSEAHRILYNALLMLNISWPPDEMSEKFQFSFIGDFASPYGGHNRWDPDIGRHRKYKMTAAEPEAVISHIL